MFNFDMDLVVGHRVEYPMLILRRVADVRKNLYNCYIKTKPDSLIYRGYRDSTLQK